MALTLGCLPGLSAFAAEEGNDVTINVWLSNAEMGDPVERFSKSERMYTFIYCNILEKVL
jgi:hypothetical protein